MSGKDMGKKIKSIDINRLKGDAKYIFLNMFVNKIPCWTIRKKLYKSCGMQIGAGARIGIGTVVVGPENITIGKRSVINEFCHLDGRGGLKIGNDTSVSVYTTIITAGHDKDSEKFRFRASKTKIGDNVWIGARAIILEGSVIDDFAVIGAGCVFKGTAKRNEIYIGNKKSCYGNRNIQKNYELDYHPFFR